MRDVMHRCRKLALLGSTGTIGRLTLDVVARFPERLEVITLAAGRNIELLAEQTVRFGPERVALADREAAAAFRARIDGAWKGEILAGPEGLVEAAGGGADVVVNGLVGSCGLGPSLAALGAGKTLALANKESLVVAGELMRRTADRSGARILPIDSEHSGLMQCLEGRDIATLRRAILTASGGPFRAWPLERLSTVTAEEALRHPTWRMGPRITIDSATLLNKGFEVHEARWLFDLEQDRIDIWIHPQSVVHALAEWNDGSIIAQLSVADMRLPIQQALFHPERPEGAVERCDLTQIGGLDFEPVEDGRYPCLGLARECLRAGGTAPAVLNAADEVLVGAFLEGRIRFLDIAAHIERVLARHRVEAADGLEPILRADAWARGAAGALVAGA
jgi:1-deoxy-D-xylulose-5-phosphate reductoisomerase